MTDTYGGRVELVEEIPRKPNGGATDIYVDSWKKINHLRECNARNRWSPLAMWRASSAWSFNHNATHDTLRWCDHTTSWLRSGERVLFVGEPYQITEPDFAFLKGLESVFGAHVRISNGDAHHYSGCYRIEVWRSEDDRWYGIDRP